jgi:hypothetical protein
MRGERRRGFSYRTAVVASVVSVLLGVGATAMAQIPTLPSVPEPPAPVTNAVDTVEATVFPQLFTVAETASPVATLGGFALRPACGELGLAAFAIGLGGASIPFGVIGFMSPAFVFCGGAFAPGPVDPYLGQVDGAAGPQVSSTWNSVSHDIQKQTASAPPGVMNDLCGGVELAYPGSLLPPPVYRIDPATAIC